jgi:hypothetical protein
MDSAKLRLSPEELKLVSDPGIILTKNAIIKKVYLLFGALADDFRSIKDLPGDIATIEPKIAKGENYLGLPYVMLDYPRYFSAGDIMAVRCFFWWGNFFSITLHLKGIYREMSSAAILKNYDRLSSLGYSLAISGDEWHHHFGTDNYRSINSMDEHEFRLYITEHPYIKIARIFPISSWENMRQLFNQANGELVELIAQPVK